MDRWLDCAHGTCFVLSRVLFRRLWSAMRYQMTFLSHLIQVGKLAKEKVASGYQVPSTGHFTRAHIDTVNEL